MLTIQKKLDHAPIEAHITSFKPQVSHYKLENSPHRRYLEPHLTITDMWKDYNSTHESISYISYQRVSRNDECDYCATRKDHLNKNSDHNQEECTGCIELKLHLERAKAARVEYHRDQENVPSNTLWSI